MSIFQLIYSSQPFAFDEATFGNLLVNARENNKRDALTGALICRRDIFLQLLEGPEQKVQSTFSRIKRDDRHVNITLHSSGQVSQRMFGAWSMLHDPAKSWLWPESEIQDGVPIGADLAAISAVFTELSKNTQAE